MAYTFDVLPLGTTFSDMGDDYVKTGKGRARRQDNGEEYEFDGGHEVVPNEDLDEDLPDVENDEEDDEDEEDAPTR